MSAAAYADCMRFAYGGIRGVGRGSRPRVGPSRRLNRAPGGASRAPGVGLTPKCCVPTRGLTREAPGVARGGGPRGYNLADIEGTWPLAFGAERRNGHTWRNVVFVGASLSGVVFAADAVSRVAMHSSAAHSG